jgi:hypothetical protein
MSEEHSEPLYSGFDLDIYALTTHRDRPTITRFLNEWVNVHAAEDRGDEELMLLPLGETEESLRTIEYEWEPAQTLTHSIQRGLDRPPRAFRIYLASKQPSALRVYLAFTLDDRLVLGIKMYNDDQQETLDAASVLLNDLAARYHCWLGMIVVEQAAPLSEPEFRTAMEQVALVSRTYPL